MGDGYHRAGILLQMLLEPVDRLGVEVVGRFVEQQHVGLLEQQAAESHATALAPREGAHLLIVGRALQGIHGTLELGVYVPGVGGVERILQLGLALDQFVHLVGILEHVGVAERGVHLVELLEQIHHGLHALADHFDHGLLGVELRFLLEISYGISGREHHLALVILVNAGDDFQQRRFTGAVETDDADFGAIEKGEIYVFENLFLGRVGL